MDLNIKQASKNFIKRLTMDAPELLQDSRVSVNKYILEDDYFGQYEEVADITIFNIYNLDINKVTGLNGVPQISVTLAFKPEEVDIYNRTYKHSIIYNLTEADYALMEVI